MNHNSLNSPLLIRLFISYAFLFHYIIVNLSTTCFGKHWCNNMTKYANPPIGDAIGLNFYDLLHTNLLSVVLSYISRKSSVHFI